MKKIAAVIAVSLLVTACASTSTKENSAQATAGTGGGLGNGLNQTNVDTRSLADQLQALKAQSVYFDYDSSSVKPEYKQVVANQANFAKSHNTDIVTVAGNCDERGSSEYNLALGDRRAYAVSQALKLLGVPAGQLKTVSFGEEKPRLTCHEEKCWKENRRVDFDHKLNP
jgi:peptidoglycan-associated lipoprotein